MKHENDYFLPREKNSHLIKFNGKIIVLHDVDLRERTDVRCFDMKMQDATWSM